MLRTTVAAWKSKPTFYAISKQDKTTCRNWSVPCGRMKAKTIESTLARPISEEIAILHWTVE